MISFVRLFSDEYLSLDKLIICHFSLCVYFLVATQKRALLMISSSLEQAFISPQKRLPELQQVQPQILIVNLLWTRCYTNVGKTDLVPSPGGHSTLQLVFEVILEVWAEVVKLVKRGPTDDHLREMLGLFMYTFFFFYN